MEASERTLLSSDLLPIVNIRGCDLLTPLYVLPLSLSTILWYIGVQYVIPWASRNVRWEIIRDYAQRDNYCMTGTETTDL